MHVATESAIIVPIPQAEPAVRELRERLDPSALGGTPAHITVLYPFADPATISENNLTTLSAAIASVDSFRAAFLTMSWFGDQILWLDPEPATGFVAVTNAVAAVFPEYPPYAGAFDTAIPRLTIGARATRDQLLSAQDRILPNLPIDFSVTTAELWCGTRESQSWSRRATFRLGSSRPQ